MVLAFLHLLLHLTGTTEGMLVDIIAALGILFAVSTMAYTGILLGASKGIPFWRTGVVPVVFVVSALVTGGVGPWLPYQMFAAGWVGLTAGWLRRISNLQSPVSVSWSLRLEIVLLSVFAFTWGLLYGAIINLYFWPFAVGSVEQTWISGIGLGETLARYATFYAVTSLGWDMVRAVGNVALILLLGAPTVRALTRFRRRFHFEVRPYA